MVACDNIRSRENVGAIFRTADAAGFKKVYLCGITPVPPHEKIVKAALGAESWIPWEHRRYAWRLVEELKREGFSVVALEQARGAKDIFKFRARGKVALVLGGEVEGLSTNLLKRTDAIVQIPMYGKKESLNVAVAFGIAAYQLRNG